MPQKQNLEQSAKLLEVAISQLVLIS